MNSFDFGRFGDLSGMRVLDLGAGGGRHAIEAARMGASVVCVELDDASLAAIEQNALDAANFLALEPRQLADRIVVVKGDARALPFCEGSFDLVIAAEILEHIQDDARVLAEIHRCCAPGGFLGVSVPRAFPEALNWLLSLAYHSAAGGHIRIYSKRALFKRLAAGGFGGITHHYAHGLHSPYWWLKCLFGVDREPTGVVKRFHGLLVAQLMGNSPRADRIERLVQPLIGKSIVVYARREASGTHVLPGQVGRTRAPARIGC